MVNRAIIYHHLGMGDLFTCNGLVHHISKDFDEVWLAAKDYVVKTAEHLYADFPKIKVFEVKKEPEDIFDFGTISEIPVIKIGFEHTDPMNFERSFYAQYRLPLEDKFTKFRLPSDLSGSKLFYIDTVNRLGEDYIFIHSESTAGKFDLQIDSQLPRFTVSKDDTPDILDYVHTVCNAKEVHFINSGIYPLVSLLDHMKMLKAEKIVYHNTRKFHQGGLPIEIPNHFKTINY